MKSRITIKFLIGNLIFIAILLLIFTRFLSVWSGTAFPINLISAGSMTPTLMEGDIVAWVPSEVGDVKVGDVIVFKSWLHWPEERFVVHRVVEIKSSFDKPVFVTKGDANDFTDQAGPHVIEPYVTGKNFIGKVLSVGQQPVKIPLVGIIGIWANDGFKMLSQPTASKGSLAFVGVFAPLTIAIVLFIVSLFILPERTKTVNEKLRLYIFGSRPLNIKKTFLSFLILYILLLSFIHVFAYDSTEATLGIGEFPEKSSFELGSISPGSTTIPKNLPVLNPGILAVKGIIVGDGGLSPFVNQVMFHMGPGNSSKVPVTASAGSTAKNGTYGGHIMVFSSPLWFLVPDQVLKNIRIGGVPGTIFCIDFVAACILTCCTVGLLASVSFVTNICTIWMIDRSWRHKARLLFKKNIGLQLKTVKRKVRYVVGGKIGWIINLNLGGKEWKKPVLASMIFIPLIFVINSELLVMIIASITAGVIAYFISCKQRKQIVVASLLPMILVAVYAILKTQLHLLMTMKNLVTFISLGVGMVAIYMLVLAFFLLPFMLFSWYLTRQIRNLKEQKDPLLILEGRCDL